MMDRACEKLLAGTGFAKQQDCGFRLRDALSFTDRALERFRLAEYSWKAVATRPLFTQQHVLSSKSRLFERALDEQQQMIRIDWFLEEVVCAVFHRLYGLVDRAESSHDDHRHIGVGGARGAQYVEARAVRHAEVSEDETMTGVCDFVQGRAGVARFGNGVSGILECQSQYATQAVFIFDE